ncbi:ABC transporter permease [Nocardioides sp. cx-173]|uniref:ABC transporter permease n=1 Tax=Nocardioides sp. cx-173 TaxID=2898796 RepID=UPI001E325692|nr:ABC transporter permease [Nocardioides sp. cx-173]MCD4527059.1 ABC transporter permease [Nocardioides sp. cx-173]UGB41009.1 ABC transporter permease [Nocardioides sp. cx-173]
MRRLEFSRHVAPLLLFAAVLAAWQFLPGALGIQPFIFPKLSSVLESFTSAERLEVMYENFKVTLGEAMAGLLIGGTVAIILGFLLGTSDTARRLFYPYLIALQGVPKVALAPLLLIWFGFGATSKILLAGLLCFFPLLINTMSGVNGVDPSRVELFKSMNASRMQIWSRLLFPTALPSIFAGIELVSVYATLGAIVAEFISAQAGVGVLLQNLQHSYDTAGMFAVFLVLSVMGVAINQTVRLIRRRVIFWEG